MSLQNLFLLLYFELTLVNAEDSTCLVFREDNPNLPPFSGNEYSSIRVDYCTSKQKCCKTGCCDKSTIGDFGMIFGLLFLSTITFWLFTCCKKCCEQESTVTGTHRQVPPFRINTQHEQRRNENVVPHRDYGDSQNLLLVSLPNRQEVTVQVENTADPVTPPPSYDVAVSAPSAPSDPSVALLRLENRLPSYENVTEGRMK